MNKQTDKHLDDLSRKVMLNASIERPSMDFTAGVLSEISEINSATVRYKPLISKKVWLTVILLVVVLTVLIAYTNGSLESPSLLDSMDFGRLTDNKIFQVLGNISVSKTFVYAVLLFGVMFGIQISLLKSHFNKRFG